MKINCIKYKQLLFLYAYFRYADLSLDRSRWFNWNEFQKFSGKKISPSEVLFYLKEKFNISNFENEFLIANKKVGLISRIKSFVTKDIFLTEESMRYYCELLYLFKQELEKNDNVYDQEIEKLRIDIALFYMNELKPWISKRDLDKLMKIEHFQESNSSTLKLINFIPDDFYKT